MRDMRITAGSVTSFTLVWIKIIVGSTLGVCENVTSFTLVWIKIWSSQFLIAMIKSRASRSCGLK